MVKRRVVCADGTGLLACDTSPHQEQWPQQRNQKEGCAFPQLRLCGLFNLHSGIALSYKLGNKRSHELPLLRAQETTFQKGDIFVGDKGFICFYVQARLHELGVDSIVALSKRRPVSALQSDKGLAANDLLISLPKFTSLAARRRYPKARWDSLPETLQMRQIKVNIAIPGYRTQSVYLLTTLLDHKKYPAEVVSRLYRERWKIELFFRDLKTTMGMEFIQAKTPPMVEKSIMMFFIAYNLIRTLICEADTQDNPTGLSFKACIQVVMAYSQKLDYYEYRAVLQQLKLMRLQMASTRLISRERLCEPRVVKRRPKPFKMMMKPRHELRKELYQNVI